MALPSTTGHEDRAAHFVLPHHREATSAVLEDRTAHRALPPVMGKTLSSTSGAARLHAHSPFTGKVQPSTTKARVRVSFLGGDSPPLHTDADRSHHRPPLAGRFTTQTPFSRKLPRFWPRSSSRWRAGHSTSHPQLLESSRWRARHSTSSRLPPGVGVVRLVCRTVHRSALPLDNLGEALAFFWI